MEKESRGRDGVTRETARKCLDELAEKRMDIDRTVEKVGRVGRVTVYRLDDPDGSRVPPERYGVLVSAVLAIPPLPIVECIWISQMPLWKKVLATLGVGALVASLILVEQFLRHFVEP